MDYRLLMHDDAARDGSAEQWDRYFEMLGQSGSFAGGSSIGKGVACRMTKPAGPIAGHLNGFIRVRAASLDDARRFLGGNPVYENGGTVEIRELPKD
jgi:hypothetical protein